MNSQVSNQTDVVIIGGGAAGLATAIFALRHAPHLSVVILDGARKPGAKILVSGGGRCNVTNEVVTARDFHGSSARSIQRVLNTFTVEQTVAFFDELGVELKREEHGKLFPVTDRAGTVLFALMDEVRRLGASIRKSTKVTGVKQSDGGFSIVTESETIHAGAIVLATGGKSLPKTGSDGSGYGLAEKLDHTIRPLTPALVPLLLDGEFHKSLSGISQEVELTAGFGTAKPYRVCGSLLWTHFGISGPVVLDLSRHWHDATRRRDAEENCEIQITANLMPGHDFQSAEQRLLELVGKRPAAQLRNMISLLIPSRVAAAIVEELTIDGTTSMSQLDRDTRRRLVRHLVEWPLPVTGSRGFTHAEVTAGGVPLSEIDVSTMSSRKCTGLYLVGEILDVDGRIGGFNFQWSWSSAFVAGRAIGDSARLASK